MRSTVIVYLTHCSTCQQDRIAIAPLAVLCKIINQPHQTLIFSIKQRYNALVIVSWHVCALFQSGVFRLGQPIS